MEINFGHRRHSVVSILHIPLSMDLKTVCSLQSYLTCLGEPSLHQSFPEGVGLMELSRRKDRVIHRKGNCRIGSGRTSAVE